MERAPMSGSLRWGVKQSLHEYAHSSEGTVDVGDGAVLDAGEITFPADDTTDGAYCGFVRFRAHAGMLDWQLASPRIERDGTTLTVERRDGTRIVFATIRGDEVQLAIDGTLLFESFYPVGAVLDPIRVVAG
jgi:hypothetical protein